MLKILRALNAQDRATLMAFGEFLLAGGAALRAAGGECASVETPPSTPQHEPRPPDESVVAAIKRLRRVYPMLDPSEMLHETSALMAAHVLQGRDAGAVIDELERLFLARYETQGSRSAEEPDPSTNQDAQPL
ncbi:hypothetical protein [Halochromatium salexigens]|nr:hypothetical protein [Halochromatium salexigens]